jgi:hypothetical protein
MPFYCGKRSAGIWVVLGPKKSSAYSSEYASGFFEPAASHLPASPFPRNEGLLGQTPSGKPAESVARASKTYPCQMRKALELSEVFTACVT